MALIKTGKDMEDSVSDGPHENPDDLVELMEEISLTLHPMVLEVLFNKERKKWEKK